MKSCLNKLVLLSAVIFSCSVVRSSQTPQSAIPVGAVTEKIVTQSEPDQSYAVYLPSNYSPAQKWPTIFCFDPGARGKLAVGRFKSAAEKFGYIVVCSNNSRNGLDTDVVTKIVNAFWDDVHHRFPIDEQRTYFAGFSGGARLSIGLAIRCNGCVTGVFACGAGFPGDQQPTTRSTFEFIGAAGYDDFNFGELRDLENKFDTITAPHRFFQFQGGHEWPPDAVFEQVLAWFDLRAIKRGALAKNETFIDNTFTLLLTEGDRLVAAQQLIEARGVYSAMLRDFAQLRDTTAVSKKLADLNGSSELKKQLQQDNELNRRRQKEAYEIRASWMKPRQADEDLSSRSEAKTRINDWRKKKEATEDSRDRRLARRILSSLLIGSYETARDAMRNKDYQSAIANLELVRAIDPQAPNGAYELARALALSNQKKAALQALDEAVTLGFKDLDRVKVDPAFLSLIGESRFQQLIGDHK